MTELDIEEVKALLPHRYPFLLVDRVIDIVPGESLTAIKNVTANEPQFMGHFPERSIMPGVLMVEAMAQAAGILAFKTDNIVPDENSTYFLVGIDKTRFKRPVIPGDQLTLEIKLLRSKRGIWVFGCTASVAGELAVSTELMCTVKA